MEITSPRARRELQKLLSGEKLSIGKCEVSLPADAVAVHVLAQLLERHRIGPDRAVSEAEAEAFLEAVKHGAEADSRTAPLGSGQPDQHGDGGHQPKWRLHRLTARNYRGLTEWEGTAFRYDVGGMSHHVYGLNASGKTAILSAMVWCLTGFCLRDRAEPQSEIRSVGLYSDESCATCLEGGWPEVVTVPHNVGPSELAKVRPSCCVEVELRSPGRCITVSRSLEGRNVQPILRVCEGDACYESLAQVGISETDCELTMLMPGRVSALQFVPGSKFCDNLLSVCGLDALCDLAALAKRVAMSVRRVANNWERKAQQALDEVSRDPSLRPPPESVDDDLPKVLADVEATCARTPHESEAAHRARIYERQGEAVARKATEEFGLIQAAIGPERPESGEPMSQTRAQQRAIVDALAKARHLMASEEPVAWQPLASWLALTSGPTAGPPAVESWAASTRLELAERYAIWRRNKESCGRLSIKIRAAQYLQQLGRFEECPVCEQDLPEVIVAELKQLTSSMAADTDSLKLYLRDALKRLEEAVPADLLTLAPTAPAEQLGAMLDSAVIRHMAVLGKLQQSARDRCGACLRALPRYDPGAPGPSLGHSDWDEGFLRELGLLQQQYESALQRCAVGRWARDHAARAAEAVTATIGALTGELVNLERYAEQFASLTALSERLRKASQQCHEADEDLKRAGDAERAHTTLSQLMKLDTYAKLCLDADMCDVVQTMKAFYALLYPNDCVRLAALVNRASKKGAKPDYRWILRWSDKLYADGDPVSNAGRIRGLLWSYTFGLIEKQAPSLGVIALDDPYTSLDDYAATNMLTDVIVKRLGRSHQVLSTVTEFHLLAPVWGRHPSSEEFCVTHVLRPGPRHRCCRIAQGIEPLREAIARYRADPELYRPVVKETRAYLERNLKLVSEYVLSADQSQAAFPALADALAAAAHAGTGATRLGERLRPRLRQLLEAIGFDFSQPLPVVPRTRAVLHALHHGGLSESWVDHSHADYVVGAYSRWAGAIQDMLNDIDATIARSQTTAALWADTIPATPRMEPSLKPVQFETPVPEVGRVAAEGLVSISGGTDEQAREHTWPGVHLAVVTTNICAPVVLPGQIGVFAPSCTVKDGDLALMRTATEVRLRRVFRVALAKDGEHGWVGQSVNPLVRDAEPIVVRADDVLLQKLVGVLYDRGSERGLAMAPAYTDVMAVGEPWPAILRDVNAGKVRMVSVTGDSAEPVALDGQFLLVREADPSSIPDGSLCCARLSDGRMMMKRFRSAGNGAYRVLLQPINAQARYPIVEAALGRTNGGDDGGGPDGLLCIEAAQVVCGVLFREPGALDG